MVRKKRPLAIRDLVLMGLFSAILFGVQLAFAFLPNVELVSLLIILYTRHFEVSSTAGYLCVCCFRGTCFWLWHLVVYTLVYLGSFVCYDYDDAKKSVSARMGDTFRRVRALLRCAGCGFLYLFERAASSVCFGLWLEFHLILLHGIGNFLACLVLFKPLDYLLARLEHQRIE